MKKIISGCIAAIAALSCCQQNQEQNPAAAEDVAVPAKILVVVDVQRDFFDPAGSLYVGGSETLPALIASAAQNYDGVIFTLDWHPGNHCSFAAQGGIWPVHCVAYTQGAGLADEFAPILASGKAQLFFKGQDVDKEQYGAFEDLAEDSVIARWFAGCESVDVCGIAGDYCVKESTANILNYVAAEKVSVLVDCVRSIDGGAALDAFIAERNLTRK